MKWNFKFDTAKSLSGDLASFVRTAWPTLHPGAKLSWSWHYDLLAEYLTLVRDRKIQRLIINIPPRTAKSTIAAVCFPVWTWLSNPSSAFLCCSYELDLANVHNLDRLRLIRSAWFQNLFGDRFQLREDRQSVETFANQSGGAMLTASVGSRAMGRGGDYVVVDDPNSTDTVLSDTLRKAANDWLEFMLPQRLNDPATSPIVLIQQRLHEADCTGFLLETQPGEWTHIKLSLIAEEDEVWKFPISGRVVRRKKGECLDSKRFPRKVIEARRRNRLVWAGQYQQEPAPIEGNLIKLADIRYHSGVDPQSGERDESLPGSFDQKIISVDCAFKDLMSSDFVCIGVLGILGRKRFLLNVVNAHLGAFETEMEIRRQRELHGPISAVLVEAKANGSAVIQRLKTNVPGVIEIEPQGGKIARMYAASPEWQAHDWFVERNAAWAEPFIAQVTMFPNARNDDMADAMSQASIWLQANYFVFGLLDYEAEVASGKRTEAEPGQQSPRNDNLNKQAALQLEMKLRGVKPSDSTLFKLVVPPCPECGAVAIAIANFFRCQQCGVQFNSEREISFRPASASVANGCPACGSSLYRIVAGAGHRCQQCSYQSGSPLPKNGVPRNGDHRNGQRAGTMQPKGFVAALARLIGGGRR